MSTPMHDFLQPTGNVVVDPGRLELLGKQAAKYAADAGISLTDAVVQTISAEHLNGEHVRRIVEIANIEAFNQKYASMDASFRVVDIDNGPADPVAVLQAIQNHQRPREVVLDAFEYTMPPVQETKLSSFTPMVDRTVGGVVQDILGLRSKLASGLEDAVAGREAAQYEMNQALVKLAQTTLAAVREGATAAEVYSAWHRVDPEVAKVAFAKVRHFFSGPMSKVAGREIDPTHGLVSEFRKFAEHATSYVNHVGAVQTIDQELGRVDEWLTQRRTA